jgi:hypothetical protein
MGTVLRHKVHRLLIGPNHFKLMYFTIVFGTVLLFGTVMYRTIESHRTIDQVCYQIEAMKTLIRQTALENQQLIPKLQYYREHPAEAAEALRISRHTIQLFQEGNCGN